MRFASTFERLELKYLITEDRAEYVRQVIQPYCHPDPYNAPESHDPATDGVRGYQIDNLYLDSPSTYELHRMWRRADADRIKLRIRTYDDDGPAFLEMKRKVSRIIAKERCAVDRRNIRDVVCGFGGPLVDSPEQRAIYERFAHAVAKVGAEPALCVRYEREAWVGSNERYARVTFDRRIRSQPMTEWRLRGDPDRPWMRLDEAWLLDGLRSPLVLELKCENRMPMWMSALIRDLELDLLGYSKYGQGIEAMLRANRGADARLFDTSHYV